jgi:hypothetical protein
MKFLNLPIYTGIFVMSIIYLMLAFMFLPTPELARLQSLQFRCSSFYKAEVLAIEDFKRGRYQLVLEGDKYNFKRTAILDSILRAEYKIEPLYTGCVGTTDEVYHYMYIMAIQLANYYGYDFYDRAKQKQVVCFEYWLARKKLPIVELKTPPANQH